MIGLKKINCFQYKKTDERRLNNHDQRITCICKNVICIEVTLTQSRDLWIPRHTLEIIHVFLFHKQKILKCVKGPMLTFWEITPTENVKPHIIVILLSTMLTVQMYFVPYAHVCKYTLGIYTVVVGPDGN